MHTNASFSTPHLNDSAGSAAVRVHLSSAQLVELVFLLVNAAVSLVGNGLSLTVFTRSRLRGTPSSGYLAALAAADTGSAVMAAVLFSTQTLIRTPMAVLCHVLWFLTDVFWFLSAWFVVCFTGERYISVCHPLRAPGILARLRARYVAAVLTVLAAGLYIYHLVTMTDLVSDGTQGTTMCFFPKDKIRIQRLYSMYAYVSYACVFVLPTILVIALNSLIVFRLRRNSRNSQLGAQRREAREEQSRVITRTLFLVSAAFFVCNFPLNTLGLLIWLKISFSNWILLACSMLFNVSFSCNFFLYAMSGAKFRASVKRLLRVGDHTRTDSSRTSTEHL